jgi:tRNA-(ms[2]io[6]A)-hydroxylase
VLHLAYDTPETWAQHASSCVDEILLDHAHCERKAASTAIGLLFRYTDEQALVQPLSALAREELEHFELVLKHLNRRGQVFKRQKPSAYAGKLMKVMRTHEPDRLLDMLLCCAMIEARSCERMQILAQTLTDPELVELYRGLLACEARHHRSYVEIAEQIFDPQKVAVRLDEVSDFEGDVIKNGFPENRMHG